MNATHRARIANWRSLPLAGDGRCLVEASAGTGKTWTIAALYLRLLLECGHRPAPDRGHHLHQRGRAGDCANACARAWQWPYRWPNAASRRTRRTLAGIDG